MTNFHFFLFEFRQTDNYRFFKRESNRRTTITITNEDEWKTKKKLKKTEKRTKTENQRKKKLKQKNQRISRLPTPRQQ